MVCRNAHVARPRSPTPRGQPADQTWVSAVTTTAVAIAVPAAATILVLQAPGDLQFRKAVQILGGFPSGAIPEGKGSLIEVERFGSS